jgi:hypothetical protein
MKQDDQRRIEDEVRATLASLDNVPDIEAGPYFYAKVRQRLMDADSMPSGFLARWVFQGRLAPAVLGLVVLANLVTVSLTLSKPRVETSGRDAGIEVIGEAYSLGESSSAFDLIGNRGDQ